MPGQQRPRRTLGGIIRRFSEFLEKIHNGVGENYGRRDAFSREVRLLRGYSTWTEKRAVYSGKLIEKGIFHILFAQTELTYIT